MGRGSITRLMGWRSVGGWLGQIVLAIAFLALGGAPIALAQPAAPGDLLVAVQGAPALGPDRARVTIVEFSDYQCPFCRRHSSQVLPELVKEYVKTGKLRYVFRDFPITSIHPQAHRLHEAAHCAGDQGRYWEMHDRLFEDSRRTEAKDLAARARALGLDAQRFEQCVAEGVHAARVRQGVADGENARVRGTPTFFVGLTAPDGAPMRPQRLIVGAQPYAAFKQAIDGLLAAVGQADRNPFEAMAVQRPAEPVAAPDLAFRTAEGREVRLGELRGKVVLLGFFTTT